MVVHNYELGRLRLEDLKFEAITVYMVSSRPA